MGKVFSLCFIVFITNYSFVSFVIIITKLTCLPFFMRYILQTYINSFQNFFFNYLYLMILNYTDLLSNITTIVILKLLPVWKVANYADSYWFLYANKKITYEVIVQLNQ